VVNASGMDTVDEIISARAALYQRVYLHAVTRTAESLLARALEAAGTTAREHPNISDALKIWAMSDDALLSALIGDHDQNIRTFGRRIRNRQLPKKACVFSTSVAYMHMPLKSIFPNLTPSDVATMKKQVAHTPLEGLTAKTVAAGKGRSLESAIRTEVNKLCSSLPVERHAEFIPTKPLELLVVIGSAYMDSVRKDCIVLQNGELLRTSQFTTVREQQDALDIFKAVGFVMCDVDWRAMVLLAARAILCAPAGDPQPTSLGDLVEKR